MKIIFQQMRYLFNVSIAPLVMMSLMFTSFVKRSDAKDQFRCDLDKDNAAYFLRLVRDSDDPKSVDYRVGRLVLSKDRNSRKVIHQARLAADTMDIDTAQQILDAGQVVGGVASVFAGIALAPSPAVVLAPVGVVAAFQGKSRIDQEEIRQHLYNGKFFEVSSSTCLVRTENASINVFELMAQLQKESGARTQYNPYNIPGYKAALLDSAPSTAPVLQPGENLILKDPQGGSVSITVPAK